MTTRALEGVFAVLHTAVRPAMNEDDIERLFNLVYAELGYLTPGKDVLGKRGGKSGIPDVRLLNSDESIQVIVELKKPSERLADHENQLFRYVRDLKSRYGLLSNGVNVWLYRRNGEEIQSLVKTDTAALSADAGPLAVFRKEILEPTDFAQVRARLEEAKQEGLKLTDVYGLPAEQFLGAFALEPESPFGELVTRTSELLLELLERSDFVGGAYSFWQKTYARELSSDDVPNAWKGFAVGGAEGLQRFSFALETAYLLCARLILAKAIQDHDERGRINAVHMADRFITHLQSRTDGRTARVAPTAYPEATELLFNEYARTLFTSVYAQDLFDWWRDLPRASAGVQNAFALSLSRVVLSLLRFDFSALEGDLLGELYQNYFDPETRKALGEFYTPPEVVEFILDEVGYTGDLSTRLLDPATGSGTFLIAALRRYLNANAGRDPVTVLEGVTQEFRLVAFDVNPFAVLMAQINAAALLVPLYTRAIEQNPNLVLRRLPIVRTDSLRQEVIEGETQRQGRQFGFNFGSEEITAYVELPIRDPDQNGEPLRVGITFPNLEAAKAQGKIKNERLWLLALQSVFATVERISQAYDQTNGRSLPDLSESLRAELALFEPEPAALTEYLAPYAQDIWKQLRILKEDYGDGRFLKTLEDLTLGLVLKHYLQYDFVVGNPPYVRVQNIPEVQKKYWVDTYSWARGKYDIFIPFIERAVSGERPWLRKNGKLGYITPNRFLNTGYASELRSKLPASAKIRSITDFRAVTFRPTDEDQATRLFQATVYPAVITAERVGPTGDYTFKSARFYPAAAPVRLRDAVEAVREAYRQLEDGATLLELRSGPAVYADVFEQPSTALIPQNWSLMPEPERKVFGKLEEIGNREDESLGQKANQRRLQNYTATDSGGFYGFITGLDSVLVVREAEKASPENGYVYVTSKEHPSPVLLEKALLRPFVFGRDVSRWHIAWNKHYVIFPYVKDEHGVYRLLLSQDYRERFEYSVPFAEDYAPKTWAYLRLFEEKLRRRVDGRYKQKARLAHRWYELFQTSYLNSVANAGRKLMLQTASRKPEIALDEEGVLFAGSGTHNAYGLLVRDETKAAFIAGLFSSKVSDFYVKHVSSVFSSGYYSYGDQFIKNLPIPPATEAQQTAIADLARTLTDKTASLRNLEAAVLTFPDSVTAARREAGSVPDLEALERLAVLENLPLSVQRAQTSTVHDLSGNAVLNVGKGRIRLKPALAELVLAVLDVRKRVPSDTLAALNLPERERDQNGYLETLQTWQRDISRLQGELRDAETALNERVYEVYGLEGDKAVIEAFLARF